MQEGAFYASQKLSETCMSLIFVQNTPNWASDEISSLNRSIINFSAAYCAILFRLVQSAQLAEESKKVQRKL
jgi:hypothetical protein